MNAYNLGLITLLALQSIFVIWMQLSIHLHVSGIRETQKTILDNMDQVKQ